MCHHHRHQHHLGILNNMVRRGGFLLDQDEEVQSDLYDFTMEGSDGQYRLTWPALHITCDVERMRESTDHDVKADLNFTSERPTSAGHLRHGRILVTSPTAKKSMAKLLEDRDSQVDWDAVMEQVCKTIIADYRKGAPEVLLTGDMDVIAQSKWLIEPILQEYNPTMIFGPGSSGKSWLGQYLAVLVDAGMSHGGLTVEPANTLVLDWETSQDELGARITMLRKGMGLEGKSGVWYKAMSQGLASDLETVRKIVLNRNISFIVLDSLGSASAGEPESAEVVLRLFSSLRSLKVTSLCIDHTNKEGTLFGSVYKFNSARQIFEIKKDQKPGEDKLVFGLFHKKANNSKLIKDIGFQLDFSQEGQVTVARQDVRDTDLSHHQSVPDRILNAFRQNRGDGKMTVDDVTEEIWAEDKPVSKEVVRTAMSRLFNQGVLMKRPEDRDNDGKQQYALPVRRSWEEPVASEGGDSWKIV